MRIVVLMLVSLVLVSCAPTGPVDRIQANHSKFAALSTAHQELVRQGKIAPGMPGDGVFLAWGGIDYLTGCIIDANGASYRRTGGRRVLSPSAATASSTLS